MSPYFDAGCDHFKQNVLPVLANPVAAWSTINQTLAAIAWNMGFTKGHASFEPPGIIDGPSSHLLHLPKHQFRYTEGLALTMVVRLLVSGK